MHHIFKLPFSLDDDLSAESEARAIPVVADALLTDDPVLLVFDNATIRYEKSADTNELVREVRHA